MDWNIEYGQHGKLGHRVWLENHRVFSERAGNSLQWIDQEH